MGSFENMGVPVIRPALMGIQVAPGPAGEGGSAAWVYLNCQQSASRLFLLAIDPASGKTLQYDAPEGPGAWAFLRGPDDRLYFGTWEVGGLVLRFDPRHPADGVIRLGRPSRTESYIWQFTVGPDQALYACTYPQAKLLRIDPFTDAMEDLGRLDEEQMYSRTMATGPDGTIYVGIGYGRADVVAWDVTHREKHPLLPEEQRAAHRAANIRAGDDGEVYAQLGREWFRCTPDGLIPVDGAPTSPALLWEDWEVSGHLGPSGQGGLTLRRGEEQRQVPFTYRGSGSRLFVLQEGPSDKIYGSSFLPLALFRADPDTGELADLGVPVGGGEIYSFLTMGNRLYLCSYPQSILTVYDPDGPWHPGGAKDDNPRNIGPMGDGHLRPHALIADTAGRIWVGSAPPYGERGGALGVYEPAQGRITGNWRHLIPDQSISALCLDPGTGLLWGGSGVSGGGGTKPLDADAHLFGWDPVSRRKVTDHTLPAVRTVVAMAFCADLVCLAVVPQNMVLGLDPATGTERWRLALPGRPHAQSLRLWDDGHLWVLGGDAIVRIDPANGHGEVVATAPEGIHCGMALIGDSLFFGHGAHLWRYRREE